MGHALAESNVEASWICQIDKWGFNLLWKKGGLVWSPVCGEFNGLDPDQARMIYFVE